MMYCPVRCVVLQVADPVARCSGVGQLAGVWVAIVHKEGQMVVDDVIVTLPFSDVEAWNIWKLARGL